MSRHFIRARWQRRFLLGLMFAQTAWIASSCIAKTPQVSIVVDKQAQPLERLASDELKAILARLYQVDVTIGHEPHVGADYVVILNPSDESEELLIAQRRREISDQGLILKTAGPSKLIICGGSPVATLWAVYELAERLGVHYLSDRDVYPAAQPVPWSAPPELDVVMEPNMRVRCWRLLNELAIGPISWSLEENKRFVKQLAKMKFNRVQLFMWPSQPFVDYSFRGEKKGPGVLFFGAKFPIAADAIGLERLGNVSEFMNPDLANAQSPEEMHRKAVTLARGIIQQAQDLGMEVDVSLMAFEWPKNFLHALPGAESAQQVGGLTCTPGKQTSIDDLVLHDMLETLLRSHIETYPTLDYLRLSLSEHPAWDSHAQECYRRLGENYDLSKIGSFEELCARARSRDSFPGGGERVEKWAREGLAGLYVLDRLIRERELLKRPGGGSDVKLIYTWLPDELLPLAAQLLPPGGEAVSNVDYTASRQLARADLLRAPWPEGVKRQLTMTLADDNVGVLPQLATESIHKLLVELRNNRWSGYSTRYWIVGEQDPAIHYLSRASWNADATPTEAYTEQISRVCGAECVPFVLTALRLIENITSLMDKHLGIGMPVETMMTQFYNAGKLSPELKSEHAQYQVALKVLEDAQPLCREEGRFYLDYFIGRLRFAARLLDAAADFGAAGDAERSGDREAALKHAANAETAVREAIAAWAEVARDHGELGGVAIMNEFAFRPIQRLHVKLRDEK